MKNLDPITYKGDFINGEFIKPTKKSGDFTNVSPGNLDETVINIEYQHSHVDDACLSAKRAFREWSERSIEERMEMLTKVRDLFIAKEEQLAITISRETGKPLWETHTEAKAMVGKFNITFEHSLKLIEEVRHENALPGVDGVIRYRPRGVLAVIGPFNFPGHLPNGHIVPALVTGNTVVFKPSEMTPATGQLMAECFHEAGLPPGVFNLVQGLGETGRRLVSHKNVDGILFTGSYETGLKITEATLNDYWKIRALEMGGKNATVVWNDADLDKAIYDTVIGSFLSAGQRCSCTSRIFLHKDIASEFTESFYQRAKKLSIGHWSEENFMGSLINEKSMNTYLKFQDIALREGCEKIMRGKALETGAKGYYVTPSIYKVNEYDEKSIYQNTEIFGPNVAIYEESDLDRVVDINNASGYGLSLAIFTKDKENYKTALNRAKVGLLNWNRTTNGASSRLPFGGYGKSGNDRPSAHFAVYYCTAPVASLEDSTSFDPTKTMPGMNWE
ncbi:MAG: succinylglutamate-semialdehyde dehydrogenase [Bdellovibrionales bacterium]|nr:succinylglutamate-semialdehyde dehydrogenase [Bdellovibrionales bacterium]NQZ18305.1 succinylglutamate-semialdehyde dehydrogenase [Bdellovibrionales bacterium]